MKKSEAARLGVERTQKKKGKKLDKLTRAVLAAEKAGMSYGKYMATHPYIPEEDDETDLTEDADEKHKPIKLQPNQRLGTCAHCGQPFVMGFKQSNKLYCSSECRIKHGNDIKNAQRRKPGVPAVCPVCGADFVTNYQHRIYCSSECYAESQRKRNREEYQREKKKKEAAKNGSN